HPPPKRGRGIKRSRKK
ncbi:hypothetical protein VCHC62A1_1701B, partial [Vibrio cholerae HC-62A1]